MGIRVLFIMFSDYGDVASGSGVRPTNMYNAFVESGHDVILLEEQQNRRKNRRAKVREITRRIEEQKPDICYIESPSGPIFNIADKVLIRKLYNMGVPIGYFYRDLYWKFPEWAWSNFGFLKRTILYNMCKWDLKLLQDCCDVVYFPSKQCLEYFDREKFRKVDVLPPAARKCDDVVPIYTRKMIYVGGVRPADGIDDLLLAVESINSDAKPEEKLDLTIVTPTAELTHISNQQLLKADWVTHIEGSGEKLEPLYRVSDLGLLPKKRHFYMDLAISVKAFEYISHGLPVLSTDCPAITEMLENPGCGVICEDNAESIKKAILDYYKSEDNVLALRKKALEAAGSNTWEARVAKIVQDLLDVKAQKNSFDSRRGKIA